MFDTHTHIRTYTVNLFFYPTKSYYFIIKISIICTYIIIKYKNIPGPGRLLNAEEAERNH